MTRRSIRRAGNVVFETQLRPHLRGELDERVGERLPIGPGLLRLRFGPGELVEDDFLDTLEALGRREVGIDDITRTFEAKHVHGNRVLFRFPCKGYVVDANPGTNDEELHIAKFVDGSRNSGMASSGLDTSTVLITQGPSSSA
jgi:hypothetical protein